MKLKRLTVKAFRGFAEQLTFDLDHPFILLSGRNGRGKTSFFDAIQWALMGELSRLKGSRDSQGNDYITNAFSGSEGPCVELVVANGQREITIRRFGMPARLKVQAGDRRENDERAQQWLHELLHHQPLDIKEFHAHLTRTHLLEQETLLDFLREDTPAERYRMLSRFLGLSQITDKLQLLREATRKCSDRLSKTDGELSQLKRLITNIQGKLNSTRLSTSVSADPFRQEQLLQRCRELITQAQKLIQKTVPMPSAFPDLESACRETTALLGAALQRWQQRRTALSKLKELSQDWDTLLWAQQELTLELDQTKRLKEQLVEKISIMKANVENQANWVREKQQRIAGDLKKQTAVIRFLQEGKALGRQFEDCPLCGRAISYADLATHIDRELKKLDTAARILAEEQAASEQGWVKAKEEHDACVAESNAQGRRIAELVAQLSRSAWTKLEAELTRLNIPVAELTAVKMLLDKHLSNVEESLHQGEQLRSELNHLAAEADAMGRSAVTHALEQDLKNAQDSVCKEKHNQIALTQAKNGLLQLYQAVQSVETELVQKLLSRYEPVWQEFYHRLQPHPFFTELKIQLAHGAERGVYFEAKPAEPGAVKRANMVFSGGQSAGLMVVIFLSLHLYQNWTHLETIMLDDPLQNMDDINVLGLVDLLRFFASGRQLILSTHDDRFANMLLTKFRPLKAGGTIVRYAFYGLTRLGPVIRQELHQQTHSAAEAMFLPRFDQGLPV